MNKNTFIETVMEVEDTLYRVSKSILINEQDCEDATQLAILKAYKKLNTLKEEQYFKTWLIRILINECYKLKKKQNTNISYDEHFENIEVENKQDYTDLYCAIGNLPDKIKITIVLYYIEGYSIEEIKKILKIPSGTVKSRLSKGRKLLKMDLEYMEVNYE